MKTIKRWALWLVVAASVMIPIHDASAWDRGGGGGSRGGWSGGHGGYWGGGGNPHGYWGGSRGYWGGPRGYYWGGPRGYYWGGDCWNCGAAGAAIVGLTLGAIVGSAVANSAPPPVVIEPPAPLSPGGCSSIIVRGITYYNCGENRDYYDDGGYDDDAYQGRTNNDRAYNNQADNDNKSGWTGK